MKNVCVICYWHRVNDDVFETCVKTFRNVAPNALLQVYSDEKVPGLAKKYGFSWIHVPKGYLKGQRAYTKVELIAFASYRHDVRKTNILIADADLYFLDDPFSAFEKKFDVGLTTRPYKYYLPINGGVIFLRNNRRVRSWAHWYMRECRCHHWQPFVDLRNKIRGDNQKLDWAVGQDFLNACWLHRDEVESICRLDIVDVGPEYNFCPGTDIVGIEEATKQLREAYENKTAKILHLKSELKLAIYDGWLPDAVTNNPNGRWNWEGYEPE